MAREVLEEKKLPISEYVFFSSCKSAGSKISFMGKEYTVRELTENSFDEGFDYAIFSAGGEASKKFAPIAAQKGCIVVDNSSAWRMDKEVPLVVPEVNSEEIKKNKGIIANPNCSTIQAVVPLKVLDDKYKIKRIVYSTYQAVSGAGLKGIQDLEEGKEEGYKLQKFKYPIISLKNTKGIIVQDDPSKEIYPIATEASGHDEVYVGRIRRDYSIKNGVNLWVVADNLRKGAASNAIQIVEEMINLDKQEK